MTDFSPKASIAPHFAESVTVIFKYFLGTQSRPTNQLGSLEVCYCLIKVSFSQVLQN